MSPILVVAGGGVLLALLAALHKSTLQSDGIDVRVTPESGRTMSASLVQQMSRALQSGLASEMRRVAVALRQAGFPDQAAELDRAAREAARGAPPVTDVDEPPPGAQPVTPRPRDDRATTQPVPGEGIVDVDEPPPGATPAPSPSDDERRIPRATDALSAEYARMIYASAPRGPVRDLALSERFKSEKGVRGQPKFYGQGPALALITAGVVPATPWDWQAASPSEDKKSYRRQLGEAKRRDPARADLWDAAIAAVV